MWADVLYSVHSPLFVLVLAHLAFSHHCKVDLQYFTCVAEPEPVEPKLFETWSRRRNYLLNKSLLQSVWRMLG